MPINPIFTTSIVITIGTAVTRDMATGNNVFISKSVELICMCKYVISFMLYMCVCVCVCVYVCVCVCVHVGYILDVSIA